MSHTSDVRIGLMGGTFNPVHHGHLRIAEEFAQHFGLSQVQLIPCATPVHRSDNIVSAAQRMAMLEKACESSSLLSANDIELQRGGPSYTVDTLKVIKASFEAKDEAKGERQGEPPAIYFAMGTDAFLQFCSWHDWQGILAIANIVVLTRPGFSLNVPEPLQAYAQFDGYQNNAPKSGGIFFIEVSQLAISSTQLRKLAAAKQSTRFLLPDAVADYIDQHQLYLNE